MAVYSSRCTDSNDGDVNGNHGNEDYWIIKLNSSGSYTVAKKMGGSGYDIAISDIKTSDGGYIIAGTLNLMNGDVSGNHGLADYWIVKLKQRWHVYNGRKTWVGRNFDFANSFRQTPDDGYIIAGSSNSNDGRRTR
jgi:hypothetical protein